MAKGRRTPQGEKGGAAAPRKIFSQLSPHLQNLPHTPVSSLLVGTGVYSQHPGKCGAGVSPAGLRGTSPVVCLLVLLALPEYRKRWAGRGQPRKRRRRMAARQILNLEDVAAMR